MKKDLLLEIGLEEMPAAYMPDALINLKSIAESKLEEARLEFEAVETMGTPRRLTLLVKALADVQRDAVIENRGPRRDKAFAEDGSLTKAGAGFVRGQNIKPEELVVREQAGVEYVFAVRTEKGLPAADVLPGILTDIIRSLPFPKSMRWGYSEVRFPRPIRWLVALFGKEVVDVRIENVAAGDVTYGHRFLAPGPIKIGKPSDYESKLRDAFVIVDPAERSRMIWEQAKEVAAAHGGQPADNQDLLTEVTHLVEYPAAFYGQFSPDYLSVPQEVLTTTMIENQRYFPVFGDDGKLLSGFIGVRNGLADENLDTVKAGNERVIKARLEDAYFFYREDLKKPLADYVPGLAAVTYQERLGTVLDKVHRLQDLAGFIGGRMGNVDQDDVKRAAYLCKADLQTSMVFEFTELQGIMGSYYAAASGEKPVVARAIFEHYLPRFAGDELPDTPEGTALSLAEKMDNLVACFSMGVRPTGSQDPYALRRQALGFVNIIFKHQLRLSLSEVIASAYSLLARTTSPDLSLEQTVKEVSEFIFQRIRGLLLDEGMGYDAIDAVMKCPGDDVLAVKDRVMAVENFKRNPAFEDFMVVFNRSSNLGLKAQQKEVADSLMETDAERELWKAFKKKAVRARRHLEKGEYQDALSAMSELRPQVDAFFDAVMVMVEDHGVRQNRLAMLRNIADICLEVADFKQIVG